MKKKFSLAIILVAAFVWLSCGREKTKTSSDKKDTTITPQVPKTVVLKCVDKGMDEYENPKNDVVLSINGKDSVIARINGCSEIQRSEYKRLEIPDEATTACGGWWAGAGDYFYAYIKDGVVKVFQGWQDEEQTDEGFHWKEMELIPKAK